MPTNYIKVSSDWKTISQFWIKVSTTWKSISQGWINVAGVWKQFFGSDNTYTFSFGNTVHIGTNGYISLDGGQSAISIASTVDRVLGILPADLELNSIRYAADSSNFYVFFRGKRLGQTNFEIEYEVHFTNGQDYALIKLVAFPSSTYSLTGYYVDGSSSGYSRITATRTVGAEYRVYFGTTAAFATSFTEFGTSSHPVWLAQSTPTSGSADDGYISIVANQGSSAQAPTSVTASSITGTTATVSWSAITNANAGMSAIQSYDYSINGGSSWTSTGTSTSASITGLSSNTSYTVLVRANNYFFTGVNYGSVVFSTSVVQYTVTWDANGGTVSPTSNTVNAGVSVTAPTPTRSGFTFSTWRNPLSGGDPILLAAGASYTPTANITFFAIWTANTYTVSYDANGGTGAPASQTKTHDVTLTLSSTTPTRTGFTFSGWNTASNGTGTSYSAGGSYTVNAAVTLFAQWTQIQYTVTWDANGGTVSPTSNTVNAGVSVTAPTPTRSGFTFSTWRNPLSGGDPILLAAGASYTPTANITFFAIWVAITPNVTQITALGLGNVSAPYIRFTFTSTNAASLSIMLYRSATSSTGPWTALQNRSIQSTSGTLSVDFSSRTGTTSNWYYVDVIPYSGAGGTGTAGTLRTSRVKRGSDQTTTTVYP
jgi:uncharacterized repeat protein (TIGR02543 family)